MPINVKPHLLKIDHDDNLLFLQFKAALEREQQVHNVNHEIAISLDKYTNCPLSGTEIAELTQPLRSMTCGHIFERQHIMNYMGSSLKGCPVIGMCKRSNRLQFCNARQTSAVFCFSGHLSFTFGLNKAFSG
uniref:SP-RING-type domain-containing protein n=1 Tax=Oryza barthii TaxID=65489 RepID=A0A0D3EQG0_9ORYZ